MPRSGPCLSLLVLLLLLQWQRRLMGQGLCAFAVPAAGLASHICQHRMLLQLWLWLPLLWLPLLHPAGCCCCCLCAACAQGCLASTLQGNVGQYTQTLAIISMQGMRAYATDTTRPPKGHQHPQEASVGSHNKQLYLH
jgi:hypothetical protein